MPGGTYACTFVPSDTANYNTIGTTVAVEVTQATPVLASATATQITYGQSLADAQLDGSACYSSADTTPVEGTLSWEDSSIKPTVADSGSTAYNVIFTPSDTLNYTTATGTATITVAKAAHPATMPSAEYNVPYGTDTLVASILADAEGWVFDGADLGTALEPDVAVTFVARYVGADAGNYEQETAQVQITRSTCAHEQTELRDVVAATCTEKGYTGDTYCTVCGTKLQSGQETGALGHSWNKGTVTKEPTCTEDGTRELTCTECQATTTETIVANGHSWAEVFTVDKPATCTEEGSESIHCTACDAIKEGTAKPVAKLDHNWGWQTVLPATCTSEGTEHEVCTACGTVKENSERATDKLAHAYGAWTVTKEATTTAEGLKQRTCSHCGEVQTETIPKLNDSGTVSVDNPATEITGEITPTTPVAVTVVDKQITSAKNDNDPKGSGYGLLQAKGKPLSKTAIKLTWKKVAGATSYVVYGNKCGKTNKYVKITTVKGTAFKQKKLKAGTYYKYLVVAVKGKAALATSKTVHVVTTSKKYCNAKSVTTKAANGKVSLTKGGSFKLSAKAQPKSKKLKMQAHRGIAYESSNKNIATVTRAGVVKAKAKGACYVYAYAQNGVCKAVKVTVK